MTVLLVWESIPDSIDFYAIPEDNEIVAAMEASAGLYINSDDLDENHPIFELSEWLATDAGKSCKLKGPSHEGPFSKVISTGCMM